jgi:leucyl-tRNA synthetase
MCAWLCAGTVLANEEVINGLSERGNHPVERMPLRQWVLRITQYADRLEHLEPHTHFDTHTDTHKGTQKLEWAEGTVSAQHSWIGKSTGATIKFKLDGAPTHTDTHIDVFTTRPDTLMGVSFLALAPEHPLVRTLTADSQRARVEAYVAEALSKSDLQRTVGAHTQTHTPTAGANAQTHSQTNTQTHTHMTGAFIGSFVTHPVHTHKKIPIYIADYVLPHVGSGAVMGVPAHDTRDFAFARSHDLPIIPVEEGTDPWLNKPHEDVVKAINECVGEKKAGESPASVCVRYKLRDWVFSRQRYWGEPIPIYFPVEPSLNTANTASTAANTHEFNPLEHEHTIRYDQPIPVDESELPLVLPEMSDFHPGDDPKGCLGELFIVIG